MKLIKLYTFILCLITGISLSHAQINAVGIPSIKNFSKSDYRGGTQNWDIDQDINGNVYFANQNGLLQFDGLTWRVYRIPNSLDVRAVKVDNNSGRIFVGGYNEFGYFESGLNGQLVYTSLMHLITDSNHNLSDFIWKIHVYNDEVVFQSFMSAYIYKNNKINVLKAPNRFQFSFVVNDALYFQDIKDGILEYKKGFLHPLKESTFFNNSEIWGMFSIPQNKILIATLEKGLFIYQDEKITPWNTEANSFIKQNGSLGGAVLKNNALLINSVLNGLIICDLKGKITQHLDIKKGLQNNTVLKSYVDDKNDIWLGLDNGITFVNQNSPFTFFNASYNLSTVYASAVYDNYLYAATNQGVFYHELNKSFLDNNFSLVNGITAQSWNIQVIGNELVCANNNGAYIIKGNSVVKKLDNQGYFAFKETPSNPNFVIGANYGGFSLFEKTKTGLEYKGPIEGFTNSTNFFEIDETFLWLIRDQHLYKLKLDINNKKFTSIETIVQLRPSKSAINSLQKINNTVYFESQNHFYTYSKEKNVFNEAPWLSNLFSKCPPINYVKEDSHGNLWYRSGESLGAHLKDDHGNFKHSQTIFSNLNGYLVSNYLSINTYNQNNIFIGTTNGLARFDSKFNSSFKDKPKVYIRSFSYAQDTIIHGNPKDKKREYIMPYAQNNVKFTFSAPEFENSQNLTFAYQLYPFDKNWSNWSNTYIKEYTNLREGNYIMKIKVRNSFGKESDVYSLNFTVKPPWYRHYLAYVAYILLLAFIIYLVSVMVKMRYRKREYYKTIEQRKIYLEKESKIRKEQYLLEKEIEKLNRDKLQTKLRAKDKELVTNSLQVAKKNKILNNIIQKLKTMEIESVNENTKVQFNALKKNIAKEIKADNSWKDLEKHIKNVHFDFLKRLKEKHADITPRELDLSTYLLINMSTKEISEVMNISNKGVELARYRLRKKLGLKRKENLTGYLMSV
ncbi:triple tyrosine motif-containing protein [Mariniflexile aquimaris]|uniref:Triple tyrosine motif-containing protein n=1 Tax=Mariniflexile aquimaris TaxID=881009 RepID=A0ABW3BP63_9FLAO